MMFSFHLCVRRGLENFPPRWNDDEQSWLYVMVETNMMLGYVAIATSEHMFFAAAAAAFSGRPVTVTPAVFSSVKKTDWL